MHSPMKHDSIQLSSFMHSTSHTVSISYLLCLRSREWENVLDTPRFSHISKIASEFFTIVFSIRYLYCIFHISDLTNQLESLKSTLISKKPSFFTILNVQKYEVWDKKRWPIYVVIPRTSEKIMLFFKNGMFWHISNLQRKFLIMIYLGQEKENLQMWVRLISF